METKHIVFSMMIILAILFLSTEFLRKKETKHETLEANYFELMKKYYKNKDASILMQIEALAKTMGEVRGMSEEEVSEKVKKRPGRYRAPPGLKSYFFVLATSVTSISTSS